MEDHIRRGATFHWRGRDTGLLPANLGETRSLWVCRKLLPWAEEFKCIWVMNNAASALILSRTGSSSFITWCSSAHLQPSAAGADWKNEIRDMSGWPRISEEGLALERGHRGQTEVVQASHRDVSRQTSPFGDFLGTHNWKETLIETQFPRGSLYVFSTRENQGGPGWGMCGAAHTSNY